MKEIICKNCGKHVYAHNSREFCSDICKKVYFSDKYYYNYVQRKSSIMGIFACNKKTINKLPMLGICQDVYEYYQRKNAIETNREMLKTLIEGVIVSAYKETKDKTVAIEKIKNLAEKIDNNLLQSEKISLIRQDKIKEACCHDRLNFIERIFSIKSTQDNKHVMISILGLKIRLKNKN